MVCFLIDDDADDREFFLHALKAFDKTAKLVTAESGVDALAKLNALELFLPDYIFLDLNMPYMSGRSCLAQIREIKRLKNVPVIIYSTISDFEELKNSHATVCITKPISRQKLVKLLAEVIKR